VSEYIFIFIFIFISIFFSTPQFPFLVFSSSPSESKMATPEYDLIVVNGVVVTDQEIRELDIAVKDGMVVKLVERGGLGGIGSAKRMVDAEGGWVMVSPVTWLWVWNMVLM
jgi:hypothetical protein